MNIEKQFIEQVTVDEEIKECIRCILADRPYEFTFTYDDLRVKVSFSLNLYSDNKYVRILRYIKDIKPGVNQNTVTEAVGSLKESYDEKTLDIMDKMIMVCNKFYHNCLSCLLKSPSKDRWIASIKIAYTDNLLDFSKISKDNPSSLIQEQLIVDKLSSDNEVEYIQSLININILESNLGEVTEKGKYYKNMLRNNLAPWIDKGFKKVTEEDREKMENILYEYKKHKKRGEAWPLKK